MIPAGQITLANPIQEPKRRRPQPVLQREVRQTWQEDEFRHIYMDIVDMCIERFNLPTGSKQARVHMINQLRSKLQTAFQ